MYKVIRWVMNFMLEGIKIIVTHYVTGFRGNFIGNEMHRVTEFSNITARWSINKPYEIHVTPDNYLDEDTFKMIFCHVKLCFWISKYIMSYDMNRDTPPPVPHCLVHPTWLYPAVLKVSILLGINQVSVKPIRITYSFPHFSVGCN